VLQVMTMHYSTLASTASPNCSHSHLQINVLGVIVKEWTVFVGACAFDSWEATEVFEAVTFSKAAVVHASMQAVLCNDKT